MKKDKKIKVEKLNPKLTESKDKDEKETQDESVDKIEELTESFIPKLSNINLEEIFPGIREIGIRNLEQEIQLTTLSNLSINQENTDFPNYELNQDKKNTTNNNYFSVTDYLNTKSYDFVNKDYETPQVRQEKIGDIANFTQTNAFISNELNFNISDYESSNDRTARKK